MISLHQSSQSTDRLITGKMKTNSMLFILTVFVWSHASLAVGSPVRRAEDTCGDPSLAVIFVEGFSRTLTAHNVNFLADFVNADTINTGTVDYEIQGEIFRAWKTPQINTVPLFRMGSDTLASDIILATSTTTDPPTVSGFPVNFGLIAYVYTTQICSSVPLYQLSLPARTDHWVTTDASERDALVNFGWTDEGIVSYVLPLYDN